MLATVLERLAGLSGATRIATYAAAAIAASAAAAAAYGVWHHEIYKSGYDRAVLDIAQADAAAIGRASELRNAWKACRDAGRRWDQTSGRCL